MKLSDLLEILGFACFVIFAGVLFPPAALAVAGAELVFLGYSFSSRDIHLGNELLRAITWVRSRRSAQEAGE